MSQRVLKHLVARHASAGKASALCSRSSPTAMRHCFIAIPEDKDNRRQIQLACSLTLTSSPASPRRQEGCLTRHRFCKASLTTGSWPTVYRPCLSNYQQKGGREKPAQTGAAGFFAGRSTGKHRYSLFRRCRYSGVQRSAVWPRSPRH